MNNKKEVLFSLLGSLAILLAFSAAGIYAVILFADVIDGKHLDKMNQGQLASKLYAESGRRAVKSLEVP